MKNPLSRLITRQLQRVSEKELGIPLAENGYNPLEKTSVRSVPEVGVLPRTHLDCKVAKPIQIEKLACITVAIEELDGDTAVL